MHETIPMNRINMNAKDANKPVNKPANKQQLGTKEGEELGYCLRTPIPTRSRPRHRPAIKASTIVAVVNPLPP